MFCPNCGTENAKSQKFCTRCGTNLLAIDRAREIVSEMTGGGAPTSQVSPNLVFATAALSGIIGIIVITLGTVELFSKDNHGPAPVMFCLAGFATLVLICRYLISLIKPASKPLTKNLVSPAPPVFTPTSTTNRPLNEAPASYQSIVEDSTRQFDHERRSNS
ncbi:MAG: zinc-ribbon domain-containing protein [Blastocatellia bacterium]